MCAEDDELAVRHEDLWGLVRVDGGEEGVDGVGYRGDVLLTLLLVEEEELPVAVAQLGGGGAGGGASRAILGLLVGWRVQWGRDPARHVVVDWPADFLLQPLKLFNLERRGGGQLILNVNDK